MERDQHREGERSPKGDGDRDIITIRVRNRDPHREGRKENEY
jgi:hypothetical protein